MITIGLKITQSVPTNLGNKANTMFRTKSADGIGKDANGDSRVMVVFHVYESRAKYDAGDAPLSTAGFKQYREVIVAQGVEIGETSLHQSLKTVLEGEGYTVTEETVA